MDEERGAGGGRGFVTSEDVARRAGVSRSAVSRTFTEGASVSDRTRQAVLKAAEELGYRVNRLARGLISERSTLVGVLGANLSAPYMASQLDALSRALLQEGMQCLLLNAAEAESNVNGLIDQILEFRARAIVVMSGAPPSSIVKECIANGVRVILVNKLIDGVKTDTILADDDVGARLAADALIQSGCRRPAIVSSAVGTSSLTHREAACAARFSAAGLTPVRWSNGPTAYETGVAAARELLAQHDIDGVFCVTDLIALGFLDAARDLGRTVPDDIQVIGFDDIPQASWLNYRMTTVRQPVDSLTEAVIKALLRDAETTKPIKAIVELELVRRATTR